MIYLERLKSLRKFYETRCLPLGYVDLSFSHICVSILSYNIEYIYIGIFIYIDIFNNIYKI